MKHLKQILEYHIDELKFLRATDMEIFLRLGYEFGPDLIEIMKENVNREKEIEEVVNQVGQELLRKIIQEKTYFRLVSRHFTPFLENQIFGCLDPIDFKFILEDDDTYLKGIYKDSENHIGIVIGDIPDDY